MADFDNKTVDELRAIADEQYNNGNYAEAVEYYIKCAEKEPSALMYNRVGFVYSKINNYIFLEEQIKYHKKALELEPNYTSAIRNLAFAYSRLGDDEKAVEYFHKLFELESIPDDYCAYGCLMLKLGDFEKGWEHYKKRFCKHFGATFYPKTDKPEWQGEEIKDKTLLIQCEQGFGDTLQFLRYLEQIKPLAKKIIFVVQKGLVDLVKDNTNDIEIVEDTESLYELEFDYHIPLLNLPCALKVTMANIPLAEGYIKADEEKIKDYKEKYFNNDSFKIGISFKGAVCGNHRRDIPLSAFYPLTTMNNVKLYSFQRGGANQLKNLPPDFKITDLSGTFKDFSDTAAAMANVDLFVTSDNSVFNLAGAMGKKTFVLLSKDAEWRWFLDEETTPWYDSVKIFKKQTETENWDIPMKRIVEEINKIG